VRSDPASTAESAARERLAGDPRTAALAAAPFVPVPGGLSNHGWRVGTGGATDRFVRLARAGGETLGADRQAECEILHRVAAAGIAPRVIRCDPEGRLLVTAWIDTAASADDLHITSRQLHAVAEQLARLHSLSGIAGTRRVDFAMQARSLEAVVPAGVRGDRLGEVARGVFGRLAAAAPAPALCHHDLHRLNLLFDRAGRLWLVDWEYAGLGDPVFDLASFSSLHRLGGRSERTFLEAYRAAGGQVEPVRLPWARWAFDYVQWLWYRAASLESAAATGDAAELARRAGRLGRSLLERASRLSSLR
jgi:thiamine kinase-like enzyme